MRKIVKIAENTARRDKSKYEIKRLIINWYHFLKLQKNSFCKIKVEQKEEEGTDNSFNVDKMTYCSYATFWKKINTLPVTTLGRLNILDFVRMDY